MFLILIISRNKQVIRIGTKFVIDANGKLVRKLVSEGLHDVLIFLLLQAMLDQMYKTKSKPN